MAFEVSEVLLEFVLAVIICLVVEYFRRKPQIYNIASKSVLVTGCDTGFGNKLAKRLDGLGCRVFAGLWGLVNNAGISASAYTSPEYLIKSDLQEVLDVNILGLMDMTVHFLPLLTRAKGRIVNTSSVAGRVAASPHTIEYTVSKYGVEAFSDAIRSHMKKYGCHVSIVEPGLFTTNIVELELSRSRIQKAYDRMSSDDQEALGADYVDKTFANVKKSLEKSANPNLDEVVDAYQHALFAVYPKKRYSCGWDSKYIFIPLSYMPSWLQDFVSYDLLQDFFPIADVTKFRK